MAVGVMKTSRTAVAVGTGLLESSGSEVDAAEIGLIVADGSAATGVVSETSPPGANSEEHEFKVILIMRYRNTKALLDIVFPCHCSQTNDSVFILANYTIVLTDWML
ncbi:MAG TPA: hypothetical protein ENI27_09560 [bacterium]|nr:hypothetical protein [bacterium]